MKLKFISQLHKIIGDYHSTQSTVVISFLFWENGMDFVYLNE